MNLYTDPHKFGLTPIQEIDWSDGCYVFNITAIYQNPHTGKLYYAEDSGCSCPTPFENQGLTDLTEITSLNEFHTHLNKRHHEHCVHDDDPISECSIDRSHAIAHTVEKLHKHGIR